MLACVNAVELALPSDPSWLNAAEVDVYRDVAEAHYQVRLCRVRVCRVRTGLYLTNTTLYPSTRLLNPSASTSPGPKMTIR